MERLAKKRIAEPRGEPRRPTIPAKPSKWQLIFPVIGLAVAAWFGFAYLYTEYLWFSDMGFVSVFSTIWTAMTLASLTVGIGAGVLTWLNLRLAVPSGSSPCSDMGEIADFDDVPNRPTKLNRQLARERIKQPLRRIPPGCSNRRDNNTNWLWKLSGQVIGRNTAKKSNDLAKRSTKCRSRSVEPPAAI